MTVTVTFPEMVPDRLSRTGVSTRFHSEPAPSRGWKKRFDWGNRGREVARTGGRAREQREEPGAGRGRREEEAGQDGIRVHGSGREGFRERGRQ